MVAVEQCSTCDRVMTEIDSEECVPIIQATNLEPMEDHEVEFLAGKFHDREAQQKALSQLEAARTYVDTSKLRISFNR